ncbi:uncharacterized protein LOC129726630 [Wyeomyia smithii]|uniref:uncharacterized protein LOC129726630 n=1 Tax=Wyeomyia smithii TaxID=174621 RepID=UPI0024680F82|nr:uncharacterized protein LOC129726630 [Wyeomyia smithii]
MKSFVALLVATLAVATQGSYVQPTYWPSHSAEWNSWNNGWNGWNDHQVAAYPYQKSWTSSWPVAGLSNNGWNGYYGAVDKVKSWAQPWGHYGAGWGYQNIVKTVVPSVKLNPGGLPWGSYGAGAYGWEHPELVKTSGTYGAGWEYQNLVKTVVPSVKVNSWGLPWGSYGAGAYGWEHPEVVKTSAPVVEQVAYADQIGVGKVLVH